ncbi:ABA4-like family protein [Micromonospora aurantiaca]|uniref:ABA4-like family protein n=1 Tax=Micromonospora aurantiaca (nom. illeg.) TaxID=47850 RepID=UPI0037F4A172
MSTALFSLTFALAAPFWALMILAPRWSWTGRIVGSPLIVAPVLLVYAALVLPALGTVLLVVTAPTLDGLRNLLGTADGAAAAWAHMIAFDLFVGRWIWQDSRERGLPALLTAPVLLLTVLLGPIGLAVHLGLRSAWRRPANAVATAAPVA